MNAQNKKTPLRNEMNHFCQTSRIGIYFEGSVQFFEVLSPCNAWSLNLIGKVGKIKPFVTCSSLNMTEHLAKFHKSRAGCSSHRGYNSPKHGERKQHHQLQSSIHPLKHWDMVSTKQNEFIIVLLFIIIFFHVSEFNLLKSLFSLETGCYESFSLSYIFSQRYHFTYQLINR